MSTHHAEPRRPMVTGRFTHVDTLVIVAMVLVVVGGGAWGFADARADRDTLARQADCRARLVNQVVNAANVRTTNVEIRARRLETLHQANLDVARLTASEDPEPAELRAAVDRYQRTVAALKQDNADAEKRREANPYPKDDAVLRCQP